MMRREIEPPVVKKPLTTIKKAVEEIPKVVAEIPHIVEETGKFSLLTFSDRTVIGRRKELEKLLVADKKIKAAASVAQEPDLFEDTYTAKKSFDKKKIAICIVEILIGLGFTYFGVINAGSYFQSGTRFGGTLFEWMYVNQLGTVIEVWGLIIVYDGIKRIFS